MIIKIDYREKQLFELCIEYLSKYNIKNTEILIENLPIGDIILCHNENESVIIERKSLSDLASSIKDGRYNEQSFRLNNNNVHNHNIIYLIEGDWNHYNKSHFNKSMNQQTLTSSIVSLQYYKGFSVYRTLNISETALYIIYFADKIQREINNNKKTPYYNNNTSNTSSSSIIQNQTETIDDNDNTKLITEQQQQQQHEQHYSQVIKKVKKDNITIHNIGEILLSQIPNVSSQSAIAIMNKYKTIKNLIQHLEKDEKCLDDIVSGIDKPRKLNKNCKSSIYKYLLQIENEIIIK